MRGKLLVSQIDRKKVIQKSTSVAQSITLGEHNLPRALTGTSFPALFGIHCQPLPCLSKAGGKVCAKKQRTYILAIIRVSTASNPTCASMAPTPQQRMLSGRCSVSARVPKVNDTPLNVFLANLSIVSELQASGAAKTLANYVPACSR